MKRLTTLLACGLLLAASPSCDDEEGGTANGGAGGGSGGAGGRGGSGGSGGGSGGTAGSGTGGGGVSTGGAGGTAGAGGSSGAGGGASDAAAGGAGGSAADGSTGDASGGAASAMMSFFITSETTTTPNLGGIAMADAKCQRLGAAAGLGSKTWKAYLSTSTEHARMRIGAGPWYNFKGEMIAADLAELHEEGGKKNKLTQATGLTDKGLIVSGRTTKLPGEGNEHDILTGSLINGMAAPDHCNNWTSTTGMKQVGHSDRMGVQADPIVAASWNAAHASTCENTSAGGGAGRFYCFATN